MDPQPPVFMGPQAPPRHAHKYSPRDSQLAVIILLLFIVMLVVFYGSRALHTPDRREYCSKYCQRHPAPCPPVPPCPPAPRPPVPPCPPAPPCPSCK